jgi:hypothetical protein
MHLSQFPIKRVFVMRKICAKLYIFKNVSPPITPCIIYIECTGEAKAIYKSRFIELIEHKKGLLYPVSHYHRVKARTPQAIISVTFVTSKPINRKDQSGRLAPLKGGATSNDVVGGTRLSERWRCKRAANKPFQTLSNVNNVSKYRTHLAA